jgi:multidrug resistance efflux pump
MTSGIITTNVIPGQRVKKGELLFSVNTVSDVDDALTYILPQKVKALNTVRYNSEVFERMGKLITTNSVSLEDYQIAKHKLIDSNIALNINKENIKQSSYCAPFDGIVTKVLNYTGSSIGDGNEVMDVRKLSNNENDNIKLENSLKSEPKIAEINSINEEMLDMKVELGQKVKKGDLLFSVDITTLATQKLKDETEVKHQNDILQRAEKLIKTHSVSLAEVQEAKYNSINAIMNLKTTEYNIKYSSYYAPFDGIVTKIVNYNGSAIGDGNVVVNITETKSKSGSNVVANKPKSKSIMNDRFTFLSS